MVFLNHLGPESVWSLWLPGQDSTYIGRCSGLSVQKNSYMYFVIAHPLLWRYVFSILLIKVEDATDRTFILSNKNVK